MASAGRKRDIAIRVMVTAKEQAEIRKAANKAAMPMSVYVRAKALEASRGEVIWRPRSMKPATSPPHGAADSRSTVRRSIQRRDFAVTPCTPIPCGESALT
jgi:hypothetical protein